MTAGRCIASRNTTMTAIPENEQHMQTQDSKFPIEELYTLYSLGKEPALEALWKSGERSPVLASMLSSWHLRQGKGEEAKACLPFVRDEEERALKYQTLGLLPTLNAPLVKEPRVHLLLLVHNRIQYVEEALRQLAATDYKNYVVHILDNGSTDGSAAIAARAREFFPEHVDVHFLSMPFNIGRPLGHNWLLTQFSHEEADYIAIGDDDLVVIPPTWMRDMVHTFRCFPATALVGGKALDPFPGKIIASGARRLRRFSSSTMELIDNTNKPDTGQQDYVDLTDHVIGCLHMYKAGIFTGDIGLFDIRYSPCQYVDIDHHIRMRLRGLPIVYNGLIEFQHARAMGNATFNDRPSKGNSDGNKTKLLHKFDPEMVQSMIDRSQRELARRVHGAQRRSQDI